MTQFNGIVTLLICFLISTVYVEGYSLDRVKRADSVDTINSRISIMGNLNFSSAVYPDAVERRKIACFFVFDSDASADLLNNLSLGSKYADQLAKLASLYMAHANIVVTNAGVEMWTNGDKISFTVETDVYSAMPDYVTQFQAYLAKTQSANFGSRYAVGVLISKKPLVQGGYSQAPACTTSGVSLINYRQMPWSIGGLLAHELAHTLSVVHPFELSYLCSYYTQIPFCQTPNSIPASCLCEGGPYPPQQCLMTFQFGQAAGHAPRYTPCDIQMMNYFSSNISCLLK